VHEGHISSYFGERQTLQRAPGLHKGIDFASPEGADVVAVAAGVVTFAGEKAGYGNLVEVSHGNGLVTRYGHNQPRRRRWTVARGAAAYGLHRSPDGPHVRLEVLKDGARSIRLLHRAQRRIDGRGKGQPPFSSKISPPPCDSHTRRDQALSPETSTVRRSSVEYRPARRRTS
jgi:hypothetical protein